VAARLFEDFLPFITCYSEVFCCLHTNDFISSSVALNV
jgi:hypothetical protein